MAILAICPADWLGVKKSISHDADVYADIAGALGAIRAYRPDAVRFGGYDPTWRPIVQFARSSRCRISVSIQHTPAFHALAPAARTALLEAIRDHASGLIDEFETPHAGMAQTLSMLGVRCLHRPNSTPAPRAATPSSPPRTGLHIGIFGTGQPWKNMDTQMLAAALVIKRRGGGSIHVQHVPDPSFMHALGIAYELHPAMPAEAFAALVASMTVNLAVTFTESFGYLAVESYLASVPCLFSPMTHALADVPPEHPLWSCRVERIDDPAFIAARIDEVLARRNQIAAAGMAFCRSHVSDRPSASAAGPGNVQAQTSPELTPAPRRGMLRRLLRPGGRRGAAAPLEPMLETLRRVRLATDVIAVTPEVVRYYWLGVNRATHAMFPGTVLELPTAIAMSSSCEAEMDELAGCAKDLGFSQVVVNGFPACAATLARRFRARGIRVGCLFHGFLSECGQERETNDLFDALLRLCRDGVIARLACNKKGLPQTIERLTGIGVRRFMVPTRVAPATAAPLRAGAGGPHIGVLAYDLFRKNIHNQVAAALLVDGATVHVAGAPKLDYWGCNHRVVRHPEVMPHREFVDLLGRMDLNLHLSYSESWGQVTAESLAMGVPCMIANHSDIYDPEPVLRERLVSPNFDDPDALSREIQAVLRDRDDLAERGRRHIGALNARADALLRAFLEP